MNLVISGPSGAGKGLIIKNLQMGGFFKKSISYTTRNMRDDEINGVNYHFVTKDDFFALQRGKFFFEIVEYGNNFYGIPNKNISKLNSTDNTVFDLVPTSGINIKNNFYNTCLVYVLPPNEEVLRIRRGNRGDNRIIYDIEQLEYAKKYYDYLLINDDINQTMKELYNVISVFKNNSFTYKKEFVDNYFNEAKVRKLVK